MLRLIGGGWVGCVVYTRLCIAELDGYVRDFEREYGRVGFGESFFFVGVYVWERWMGFRAGMMPDDSMSPQPSPITHPFLANSRYHKVVIPPWPMYNRHPVKWLPPKEKGKSQ
jgi:hypothetical protein